MILCNLHLLLSIIIFTHYGSDPVNRFDLLRRIESILMHTLHLFQCHNYSKSEVCFCCSKRQTPGSEQLKRQINMFQWL